MAESFGSYLKKERELRSIPLDEVSEQTHIKMEYLDAMESDHFEKLPGITFVRGYLKAYAGYIGLLPEEVLLRFEDYLKMLSGKHRISRETANPRLFWLITFMVLVVVATVLLTWFRK
jgi:cytoskeleton protein RodZ